jgi:hypothetical protein
MNAEDKIRPTAAKIKFMTAANHTCMDYKRNEDISKEPKTELILDRTLKYKTDCT